MSSIVWGGLLYDFFYYDWCVMKFNKSYVWVYLRIVVCNVWKLIDLNVREEDIILKYMWGVIIVLLCYKESYIVIMVDKYWVVWEVFCLFKCIFKKFICFSCKFLGSYNY